MEYKTNLENCIKWSRLWFITHRFSSNIKTVGTSKFSLNEQNKKFCEIQGK